MPAPLPDDLYWNPMDLDSDESIPYQSKQYIDPWDLENYAYVRQHLDSVDSDPSSVLGEAQETSGFYYVPGKVYEPSHEEEIYYTKRSYGNSDYYSTGKRGKTFKRDPLMEHVSNYAAVDEMFVRNEVIPRQPNARRPELLVPKRSTSLYGHPGYEIRNGFQKPNHRFGPDMEIYGTPEWFNDIAATSLQIYEKNKTSSMLRRSRNSEGPVAKMAKSRSHSFSVADYDYDPYSRSAHYQPAVYQLQRRPAAAAYPEEAYYFEDDSYGSSPMSSPIYDDVVRTQRFSRATIKPKHFKLGNYGHLKIDYSFSWNNLNKYIYN